MEFTSTQPLCICSISSLRSLMMSCIMVPVHWDKLAHHLCVLSAVDEHSLFRSVHTPCPTRCCCPGLISEVVIPLVF